MDIYKAARSIALRRDLDAMSIFYEERSAARLKKKYELTKPAVPGLTFFFHGVILSDCEHFAINFLGTPKKKKRNRYDIVLRIGARLPQNYIVRNSRLMGKWGPEENSSNLPFQLKRGQTFWMQVLLTDNSFYISVNGYHFAKYSYRLPYSWITGVDVRGDVSDIVIEIYYVKEYPIRGKRSQASNIPHAVYDKTETLPEYNQPIPINVEANTPKLIVPFYGRLPPGENLIEGNLLRIEGRVLLMPQTFAVALQRGQNIWPKPTVSLFFSPNFLRKSRDKVGKAIITRFAYINGKVVNRDISRLHTHLGPGKAFVLIIACRKNYYELIVNSYSILTFKHQMNPADIDMVNIRGDVKLWKVCVEKTELPERHSYPRFSLSFNGTSK